MVTSSWGDPSPSLKLVAKQIVFEDLRGEKEKRQEKDSSLRWGAVAGEREGVEIDDREGGKGEKVGEVRYLLCLKGAGQVGTYYLTRIGGKETLKRA